MEAVKEKLSYDRALFDCLVIQRDFENEILRRRRESAEADGQKSDGEGTMAE